MNLDDFPGAGDALDVSVRALFSVYALGGAAAVEAAFEENGPTGQFAGLAGWMSRIDAASLRGMIADLVQSAIHRAMKPYIRPGMGEGEKAAARAAGQQAAEEAIASVGALSMWFRVEGMRVEMSSAVPQAIVVAMQVGLARWRNRQAGVVTPSNPYR